MLIAWAGGQNRKKSKLHLASSRLISRNLLLFFALSAHLEYDLAEVAASFEVALGCPRFCQGKTSIDDHLKFSFFDEVEEVGELAEVLRFRLEIVQASQRSGLVSSTKSKLPLTFT